MRSAQPTSPASLRAAPDGAFSLHFSRRAPDDERSRALVLGALEDVAAWLRARPRHGPEPVLRVERRGRRWVASLGPLRHAAALDALLELQRRLDTAGESRAD